MNARIPTAAFVATVPLVPLPPAERESTVFMSGNSQAVRIPKEFQLKTKQVRIIQRGDDLIIKPKYKTTREILTNLPPLAPEDENDGFALAAIIRQSNKRLPKERDLSHLFATAPKVTRRKAVKAAA